MPPPETKLATLTAAWRTGDRVAALRIAARFPRLGAEKATITRGWAAWSNPDFYRGLGHDPEALVQAGFDAVRDKYRL